MGFQGLAQLSFIHLCIHSLITHWVGMREADRSLAGLPPAVVFQEVAIAREPHSKHPGHELCAHVGGRANGLNESVVNSSYTAREKNTCFTPSIYSNCTDSVCPVGEGSHFLDKVRFYFCCPLLELALKAAGWGVLWGLGTASPLLATEAHAATRIGRLSRQGGCGAGLCLVGAPGWAQAGPRLWL